MQLYNTKVVPSTVDGQWTEPPLPNNFSRARLLVLTRPFASDSTETLTLGKMMTACKLQPDGYAVLIVEDRKAYSWNMIAAAGAPKTVLMLGITPEMLSINALFRLNAPNPFLGYTFIPSISLAAIELNAAAKKELWTFGLKPVFGL